MPRRVVFYKLSHKYVDARENVPAASKQIIYYSLAVGHHLGVVDCLSSLLDLSYTEFERWLERLPDGVGRHKLEGILKWGEVEINATHAGDLIKALDAARTHLESQEREWTDTLQQCLYNILAEPVLYLIVRSR